MQATATYSQDLRERVIAYVQAGNTQKAAAAVFSVAEMTVSRWIRAYRQEGRKTPLQRGGYKKTHVDTTKLQAYLDHHPSATLQELEKALGIKRSTASYHLRKLGYRWKGRKKGFKRPLPEL